MVEAPAGAQNTRTQKAQIVEGAPTAALSTLALSSAQIAGKLGYLPRISKGKKKRIRRQGNSPEGNEWPVLYYPAIQNNNNAKNNIAIQLDRSGFFQCA